MKMRKVLSLLLAVIMIVVVFAGCTKTTPPVQPPTEETPGEETPPAEETSGDKILKFGGSGFDGVFNPILSDNVYDAYIADIIFEKLIENNPEGEFIPGIAEWDISEDHLTYTFTLKDGIKFSDGTDLTTEDVAFTYMSIAHPKYNVFSS